MYKKLSDEEVELIKRIEKETLTDYELQGSYIEFDSFMCIIEDLMVELERKKEEIEELKEEKRDDNSDRYNDYLLGLM